MEQPKTIKVTTYWRATDTVELPEGMTQEEGRAICNRGVFPEWLANGVDTSGAEITDWEAM